MRQGSGGAPMHNASSARIYTHKERTQHACTHLLFWFLVNVIYIPSIATIEAAMQSTGRVGMQHDRR
jgi:hypothetical protein